MISNAIDLGFIEENLGPKRKIVARLTLYNNKVMLDLRFWNFYQEKWIPLKKQGLFFQLNDIKRLLPKLKELIDKS